MIDVFDYTDYREYLAKHLENAGLQSRGARSKFAEAIEIQPSYVTKVLDGDANLSLEQADRAAKFIGQTEDQTEYFLILVEFSRAGTDSLRKHFDRQAKRLRKNHITQKKQFKTASQLSETDKNIFYSSWQYAAVLHALSIPKLNTKEAVAEHFKFSLKQVGDIFEFLVGCGMVKVSSAGKVTDVQGWDWLTGDRALIAKDHCNWRLMAIRSFENRDENDLHYSSVVTLSEEDAFKLKQMLLQNLSECRKVVQDSKEEVVCSLLVDFFAL